jgi:hypothetical protein
MSTKAPATGPNAPRNLYDSASEPGWTGGTDEAPERERTLRFVEDAGVRGVNPGIDEVAEEDAETDDLGANRHPGLTMPTVQTIETDEDADSPTDPELLAGLVEPPADDAAVQAAEDAADEDDGAEE